MFTGIVENLGSIHEIQPMDKSMRLLIESGLPAENFPVGTSILVNGVCLTVESYDIEKRAFWVSLVEETLNRTSFKGVKLGEKMNLETSLTLAKPLAGHLVLGHVDFTGEVLEPAPSLRVKIPVEFMKYFPEKGSVTLHGVSLTIAKRGENFIELALIPETLRKTNLGELKQGDTIHVEIDVLARYLETLIKHS